MSEVTQQELFPELPSKLPLSFERVSSANRARLERWHAPVLGTKDEWIGSDWACALAGEVGEACNDIKKLRRLDTGLSNKGSKTREQYLANLAHELADVYLYLDLTAAYFGIDLPEAIKEKFNIVSEREGFPERL